MSRDSRPLLRASSMPPLPAAAADDAKWVEMDYVRFFDRYVDCLPAEEAKLRQALNDFDSLGVRPVPYRRLAELLVVALWRVVGRGGGGGGPAGGKARRSASPGARRSTRASSRKSGALRRSAPAAFVVDVAAAEAEGLDEGIMKPYGPNASRLRLGETRVGCHRSDVAVWDACLERKRTAARAAQVAVAAAIRRRPHRRKLAAARTIARASQACFQRVHAIRVAEQFREAGLLLTRASTVKVQWQRVVRKKRVAAWCQRHFRGARARKRAKKLKRRLEKLRVASRAFLARRGAVVALGRVRERRAAAREDAVEAYERLKDELAARDGQRIFRGWYERRFGVMALRVAGTLQQRRRLWAAGRLIVRAQRKWLGVLGRRDFLAARGGALAVCTWWRGARSRRYFRKALRSAHLLQRVARAGRFRNASAALATLDELSRVQWRTRTFRGREAVQLERLQASALREAPGAAARRLRGGFVVDVDVAQDVSEDYADGWTYEWGETLRERGIVSVALGDEETYVVDGDGDLLKWGGGAPRLEMGTPGGVPVLAVAAGDAHAVCLDANRRVFAWGDNGKGALGLGDFDDRAEPTAVPRFDAGPRALAVHCGGKWTCALVGEPGLAALETWGAQDDGVLGLGPAHRPVSEPTRVDGLSGVGLRAVAVGWRHSVALAVDGRVWTWGSNRRGELGPATTACRAGREKRATSISAGFHSLRLISGRAIISRSGLGCFSGARARGTLMLNHALSRPGPTRRSTRRARCRASTTSST